jgi:hypothetical protein
LIPEFPLDVVDNSRKRPRQKICRDVEALSDSRLPKEYEIGQLFLLLGRAHCKHAAEWRKADEYDGHLFAGIRFRYANEHKFVKAGKPGGVKLAGGLR